MSKSERPYTPAASRLLVPSGVQEGSGDDLNPVLVSGFGRLSWVGADGGLTGFVRLCIVCWIFHRWSTRARLLLTDKVPESNVHIPNYAPNESFSSILMPSPCCAS